MTATYYITLTDHGSERIAQAHGQAQITLLDLVLGDANGLPYDPISKKNRTALVNQRASVPVQSVVVNGSIARVTATIDLSIGGFNIHELGLTDSTGKLVYIGNYHGGFKPVLANGASGELVLLIDIKADAGSQVLIQVDPTIVTANKQWVLDNFVKLTTYNAHVTQNQLEHNNLLSLINTEAQVRQDQFNNVSTTLSNMFKAMYPVGSWHGSNSTSYNPATAFAPFFGYQTTWYLWPYVPAGVANTSAALGQIIALESGSDTQAASTRIWQRLEDGASPPTYILTASQSSVDEGSQVTFTLTTTGLAQGTQVAWNITGIQTADISPNAMTGNFVLGSDGKATKTITIVADETNEGTETLKFSLTYIVGKFVNVTINDTSIQLEQIVNIASNQTDINLLTLFTAQYGVPTADTKAVFIVDNGVTVLASATDKYAISGGNWPAGSTREVRVMSGAKVLGRGGKGGNGGGDYVFDTPWTQDYPAQNGEDGGTAIFAANGCPITVKNYGLIAGGAGGGGAGGGVGNPEGTVIGFGSSSGGGGAPYGLAGVSKRSDYNVRVPDTNNHAKDAGLSSGGQGGISYSVEYEIQYGKGGAGGSVGLNGENGGNALLLESGSYYLTDGRMGGEAGYIYQGGVTINNLSGGTTKGRTS